MIDWRIIDAQDEWQRVLSAFPHRDFFHAYAFHQLHQSQGQPVMHVAYENGEPQFAFPFLKRPIDANRFDLTSVYGYPGPLFRQPNEATDWWQRWQKFVKQIGAVAVFSRLHPLLHEALIDSTAANVEPLSHTIAIPCIDEEPRLQSYKKTTRYEIRKLSKAGGRVQFDCSSEALDIFQEIYYATMRGLDANDFYFFDREYLETIMKLPGVSGSIGVVYLDDKPISAGLFTVCGEISQYYLGGSDWEFRKWAPAKLLLHEAAAWSGQQGATCLHLGGGMGNDTDGLFRFKSTFSQNRLKFATARMIGDTDGYRELTQERASVLKVPVETVETSGYFPCYRWPG